MRISDWSSDVCSSDLKGTVAAPAKGLHRVIGSIAALRCAGQREQPRAIIVVIREAAMLAPDVGGPVIGEGVFHPHAPREDRQSVVRGKSVSLRVDLGRRRSIIKQNKPNHIYPI